MRPVKKGRGKIRGFCRLIYTFCVESIDIIIIHLLEFNYNTGKASGKFKYLWRRSESAFENKAYPAWKSRLSRWI